jgi:hypothetical protein
MRKCYGGVGTGLLMGGALEVAKEHAILAFVLSFEFIGHLKLDNAFHKTPSDFFGKSTVKLV